MSKALIAADNIRNLLTRFEGLLELGKFLEEIGSLDQAAEEARSHAEAARADLTRERAMLEQAKRDVSDAQAEAGRILSHANGESVQILSKANVQAKGIIEVAQADALRISAEATAFVEAERAALEDLKNQRMGLNLELSEKSAELARVEGALAEARAKLGV